MSFRVGGTAELELAPSSVTSKGLKRFGFKVFYDQKDVRNVANKTVICHHNQYKFSCPTTSLCSVNDSVLIIYYHVLLRLHHSSVI